MKSHAKGSTPSWLVAAACSCINFLILGIVNVEGLLLIESMVLYKIDRQQASMPFTLALMLRYISGPPAGYIGQTFGIYPLILYGCVLSSIGLAVSYLSPNIYLVCVFWGAMYGLGSGLITGLVPQVLNLNFERHACTVNGISMAAVSIARYVILPIASYLLDAYGLEGTCLVLSGIVLNSIPAAILLKDSQDGYPIDEANKREIYETQDTKLDATSDDVSYKNDTCSRNYNVDEMSTVGGEFVYKDSHVLICFHQNFHGMNIKEFQKLQVEDNNIREEFRIKIAEQFSIFLKEMQFPMSAIPTEEAYNEFLDKNPHFNLLNRSSTNACPRKITHIVTDPMRVLWEQNRLDMRATEEKAKLTDIYCRDNFKDPLQNISFEDPFCSVIIPFSHDPSNYVLEDQLQLMTSLKPKSQNSFSQSLRIMMKPEWILISIPRCVTCLFSMLLPTILVDVAQKKGFSMTDSVGVLWLFTFNDMTSKLTLGWVTDSGCLTNVTYCFICFCFAAMSFVLMVWSCEYTVFVIGVTGISICFGTLAPTFPGLIAQYIEKERQTMAMASSLILMAPLSFLASVYIGSFNDSPGFYNCLFYSMSILCLWCGLLLLHLQGFVKHK